MGRGRGLGRRLAVGASVLLASCLATLGVLEGVVRVLAPQTLQRDEGLFMADPRRSFRLTPGFRGAEVAPEFEVPIVINSRGLRDREVAIPKPEGVFRLLVLGDSFTYGSGVPAEATYPKRLEEWIAARRQGRVEVVNAGVSGYGTFHEAAFLRDEGWAYEPDFLVVQVFPNNDVAENLRPFEREVRGGVLRFAGRGESAPGVEAVKAFLRRRSHAYRLLGDRWNLLRIRLGWEPFYAASLGVYQTLPPEEIARGWAATARSLADLAAMARARGVGLVLVYVPKNVVLDAGLQRAFVAFHRADPGRLDWELPARQLAALARQLELPLLDLTPRFRATGRPLDFYYPHNGHWNARGHELVARELLEWLQRAGVLAAPVEPQAPAAR